MRALSAILLCVGLGLAPMAAPAQTVQDAVVAQLTDQGFTDIQVYRTLLGRIRILAYGESYRREIVINPATGEILRDYLVYIDPNGAERSGPPEIVSPHHVGSGGGGDDNGGDDGGDDDSGDDDGGDDDGGDDDGGDDDRRDDD